MIETLAADRVTAPSGLPGWTRGHVIAARRTFLCAALRQVEHAFDGTTVEFYDGDREGRDALIEEHATRPPALLVAETVAAAAALDARWAGMAEDDWGRQVSYRGPADLRTLLSASWREVELHLVDLALGAHPATWTREFCLELFDFLAPRVPDDAQLKLTTPVGDQWRLGEGRPVRVHGAMTDLAAWLAGREPSGPITTASGELPPLRRLREAAPTAR